MSNELVANELLAFLQQKLDVMDEVSAVQICATNFSEDDIPTFVAKELHKLPPVTFDHVDVTSLLKDIVFLKASLAEWQAKLDASQNTVADLRKEVSELRNTVTVTRSPVDASNVNKHASRSCCCGNLMCWPPLGVRKRWDERGRH